MVQFLLSADPAIGKLNEARLERYAEAIREHEAARVRNQASLELLNRETQAAHQGIADGKAAAKSEAEAHVRDLHTKLDVASAAVEGRSAGLDERHKALDHIEANLTAREAKVSAREAALRQALQSVS